MSPAEQFAKEARYDVIVATVGLSLFLVFGLILPKDWFWYWFAPMAAFWFRYLWVRCARDEALEHMIEPAPAGCVALDDGGVCLFDETGQIVIGSSHKADFIEAAPNSRLGKESRLSLAAPRERQ